MPDQRFFKNSGPFRLEQLASLIGAEIAPGGDPARLLHDVAPLDGADSTQISFLDNIKYREAFRKTKAGACIIHPDMRPLAPAQTTLLVTKRPYKAYALVAQAFYPQNEVSAHTARSAVIDPSAKIGQHTYIGDNVVVGANAEIGDRTRIDPNTVIGQGVKIGAECFIGSAVTISHSLIGDHVRLYPGCCIGQDGFGFAPDPAGHVKVPQLGRVIIEDSVEIGANSTVDRGASGDTVIGAGTWIDNLVQIAHNVKLGRGCIIAAQTGIAGSTVVGDYAVFGGQVGVAGHLKIGSGARIAAKSGVLRDISAGEELMGYPALPLRQFMRQIAILKRMALKK